MGSVGSATLPTALRDGGSCAAPQGAEPSARTPVRLMVRPPQFDRDSAADLGAIKARIKQMDESDRSKLLAWLSYFYKDDGKMSPPQISRHRRRVTIDGDDFWLVRVPHPQSG